MATDLWPGDVVIPVIAALRDAVDVAPPGHPLHEVNVTGENEPPYPALVITDPPGGNLGDSRWLASHVIQFEAVGDPQRTVDRATLKRIAYAAARVLAGLPDVAHGPDREGPVITSVTCGSPGWSPMPTGQNRYVVRATIHSHP